MRTVAAHCRPGGVALFAPDWVRETYSPESDSGGHDAHDGRGLRYLEWSHPVRAGESTYAVDYVLVTHDVNGHSEAALDRHIEGLFGRDDWIRWLRAAGFSVDVAVSDEGRDIFVGVRA